MQKTQVKRKTPKRTLEQKRLTRSSLVKLGLAVPMGIGLTLMLGCPQDKIVVPSFLEHEFKQTDVIPLGLIEKAIHLYSKKEFDSVSFKMYVQEFESDFMSQLEYVRPVTPQFYSEMEVLLHALYNSTERFKQDDSNDSDFLKLTLIRLSDFMLQSIDLLNVSNILKNYYVELDVRADDYDYDYSLRIIESLFNRLHELEELPVKRDDLVYIAKNIPSNSILKHKDVRIGLRSTTNNLEDLEFSIEERLLKLETYRKDFQELARGFLGDDSSFELPNRLVDFKEDYLVHPDDYSYVLGNGYVEVMPTETYTVRQYGKLTDKVYRFSELVFKYKRTRPQYITGSYTLREGTMYMEVGKYKTKVEVLRLTEEAYLLGTEVLIMEK